VQKQWLKPKIVGNAGIAAPQRLTIKVISPTYGSKSFPYKTSKDTIFNSEKTKDEYSSYLGNEPTWSLSKRQDAKYQVESEY
jgi:hypothetical protein